MPSAGSASTCRASDTVPLTGSRPTAASDSSRPVTATTLTAPGTTPPHVPCGISATTVGPTTVVVAWDASPENLAWDASRDNIAVTGYQVCPATASSSP